MHLPPVRSVGRHGNRVFARHEKASRPDSVTTTTTHSVFFWARAARRPHVQAAGGDLRAAREQGEGGGGQAAATPHGAHQPGAGSGERVVLVLSVRRR